MKLHLFPQDEAIEPERLSLQQLNTIDDIALTDGVYHFEPFGYAAKAGMITIEMSGIFAAMADEEL